jgi:hypothetical protein
VNFNTIKTLLAQQKIFSDLFFKSENLSDKELEEITKTFILGLHSEASELISATNYKDHRSERNPVDREKILFKSVDIFRYLLAVLNLWGVDSEEFSEAFQKKDIFLHMRHLINSEVWSDQPVIIFDMDDVIAEFREGFTQWLKDEKDINVDSESPEYYYTKELLEAGIEPEGIFREFINDGGFLSLEPNETMIQAMWYYKKQGFWIQILTARPSDNLRCFYDTFSWLKKYDVPVDGIGFSGEKYRWLADTQFYNEGKVVCVIDDSPKHSAELAKHGVNVVVPVKSYNGEVEGRENISRVRPEFEEVVQKINQLVDVHHGV